MTPTLWVRFGVELCVLEAARVAERVTDAVIVFVGAPDFVPVFVDPTDRVKVEDAVPVFVCDTERV